MPKALVLHSSCVSVIFLPSGAIGYHASSAPWPDVSAGSLSPAKWYSGQPARVSCWVPSSRVIWPISDWSTSIGARLPPALTGIHLAAHAPTQFDRDGLAV